MDTVGEESTRARRERWWRSSFFVLGTIYLAFLLIGLLLQVIGGFAQILLVVFLAWLQERFRLPRGVALGLAYLATLLVSGFVLFYAASSIGLSIGELAEDFPLTRARIEGTLREWETAVSFGRFEADFVGIYRDLEAAATRVGTSAVGEVPGVSAAVLGSLALVVILSMYMVADSAAILAKLNRVVPARWADELEIFERTVSRAFGGFLRAQVILTAVQTVLTLAVVLILGLPYGFLIVGASALAMLIPFFGPPLALIPPIIATAIFASDWIIPVIVLLIIVQGVLVNYLQPRLMQDALGMHPLLVLIGLLIGAQVAGLWGALFGIPLFAVLNVFFNYIVNLRAIEEGSPEELEEVLEEVRQESPEATPEEVAALAADRIEDAQEEASEEAAGQVDTVTQDLRAAAGDLREAAGEQRAAAGEIGTSAAELRDAVDRLADERTDELTD